MEQIQYNLLYRWFVGLAMDDVVWVPTVFSKNHERLIAHDAVVALFNEVLAEAESEGWWIFRSCEATVPDHGKPVAGGRLKVVIAV